MTNLDYDNFPPDTGCSVSKSCLDCPLPVCRHDLPNGLGSMKMIERNVEILKMRERGETPDEIARVMHINRRTVFRALEGETISICPRCQGSGHVVMPSDKDANVWFEFIQGEHGVTKQQIVGRSRLHSIVKARHHLMWGLREKMDFTLVQIGNLTHRDHSSVLSGIRRHRERTDLA